MAAFVGALKMLNASGNGGWFGSVAEFVTFSVTPAFNVTLEMAAKVTAFGAAGNVHGPARQLDVTWLGVSTPPQTRTALM